MKTEDCYAVVIEVLCEKIVFSEELAYVAGDERRTHKDCAQKLIDDVDKAHDEIRGLKSRLAIRDDRVKDFEARLGKACRTESELAEVIRGRLSEILGACTPLGNPVLIEFDGKNINPDESVAGAIARHLAAAIITTPPAGNGGVPKQSTNDQRE